MSGSVLRTVAENVLLAAVAVWLGLGLPMASDIGIPASGPPIGPPPPPHSAPSLSPPQTPPAGAQGISLVWLVVILVGFPGAGWWESWPAGVLD